MELSELYRRTINDVEPLLRGIGPERIVQQLAPSIVTKVGWSPDQVQHVQLTALRHHNVDTEYYHVPVLPPFSLLVVLHEVLKLHAWSSVIRMVAVSTFLLGIVRASESRLQPPCRSP